MKRERESADFKRLVNAVLGSNHGFPDRLDLRNKLYAFRHVIEKALAEIRNEEIRP